MLAALTSREVACHVWDGVRLSEQLNPNTKLGACAQATLAEEWWDYVALQEIGHGPITAPKSFFSSVKRLRGQTWANEAVPAPSVTWAYQKGRAKLAVKSRDYDGTASQLAEAHRKAALDNRALLVDVGGRFYRWPDPRELYAADGVHPSKLGPHMAAETITNVIRHRKGVE